MADLNTINADIDALDAENNTQAAKIAEAMSLLDGKAAGSGGEKEWHHIKTVILNEDVQSIYIDSDEDGNPFSYDEIFIRSVAQAGEDGQNSNAMAFWASDARGAHIATASISDAITKKLVIGGFAGRHLPGWYSPTVVHIFKFFDKFAAEILYNDAGQSTISGQTYDDIIKNSFTSLQSFSVVNYNPTYSRYRKIDGIVPHEKITEFTYASTYGNHLIKAGSLFEFYGR